MQVTIKFNIDETVYVLEDFRIKKYTVQRINILLDKYEKPFIKYYALSDHGEPYTFEEHCKEAFHSEEELKDFGINLFKSL